MSDLTSKISYNPDHFTVMANDIVRGRQSMTLQAARLVRLMIAQVVKEHKDLRTYTVNVTELAKFFGVPKNNMYRDIVSICEVLHKAVVYVATGNPKQPWKMFNWISMSEYDGNGTLTIRLSEDIKPYVLELDKCFTQYQLKNILQFNSFYTLRLYELIKCCDGKQYGEKSWIEFTVQELREAMDCLDKYAGFKYFKRRIISPAICEINSKSDIEVSAEYIKQGTSITKVKFYIHINRDASNPNSPICQIANKRANVN